MILYHIGPRHNGTRLYYVKRNLHWNISIGIQNFVDVRIHPNKITKKNNQALVIAIQCLYVTNVK